MECEKLNECEELRVVACWLELVTADVLAEPVVTDDRLCVALVCTDVVREVKAELVL